MKILLENHQSTFPVPLELLKTVAHFVVLNELDLYTRKQTLSGDPLHSSFGLYILDELQMCQWNQRVFGKNKPTDVISFGYLEQTHFKNTLLGEIWISAEEAFKVCKKYHKTATEELLLYTIHGILHAFGHEDETPAPRRKMRERESFYMELFTSLLNFKTPSKSKVRCK